MARIFFHAPLVIEPAPQLIKGNHHVLPICRALLKACVPGFDIRKRRPFYLQFEITIQRGTGRYIGQSQAVACKKWLIRKHLIQKAKVPGAQCRAFVDGCAVSLFRRTCNDPALPAQVKPLMHMPQRASSSSAPGAAAGGCRRQSSHQ